MTSPIQWLLALSYWTCKQREPSEPSGYWMNTALFDVSMIAFMGPLTSWIPYAIFLGKFDSVGPHVAVMVFLLLSGTAFLLAYFSSRSRAWKDIVVGGAVRSNPRVLWYMRAGALFMWGTVNPGIAWIVTR